jgi:hypothetical protein
MIIGVVGTAGIVGIIGVGMTVSGMTTVLGMTSVSVVGITVGTHGVGIARGALIMAGVIPISSTTTMAAAGIIAI